MSEFLSMDADNISKASHLSAIFCLDALSYFDLFSP